MRFASIIIIFLLSAASLLGREIVTTESLHGGNQGVGITDGASLSSEVPRFLPQDYGIDWTDHQGWKDVGGNAWGTFQRVCRSSEGVVSLRLDDIGGMIYPSDWTISLTVDVTSYHNGDGLPIETVTGIPMTIGYQLGNHAVYTDAVTKRFAGAHRLEVTVTSIVLDGISAIPSNVFLDATILTERYDRIDWDSDNLLSFSGEDPLTDVDWNDGDEYASGQPIADLGRTYNLNWTGMVNAEEYDLEWYFLAAMDDPTDPNDLYAVPIDLSDWQWEKATRITLTGTDYELELPYEKGQLYFRIRAVGRSGNDFHHRYHSDWSTVLTLGISEDRWFYRDRNWSYSVTYSEEGLRGESLTFFDGIGRTRQAVTKSNSTGHALVGETVYDFEGRQAISVTPSPVPGGELKFYENYILNGNSEIITPTDFDEDADRNAIWDYGAEPDDGNPDGMVDIGLSSNYFTESNVFMNDPLNYPDKSDFAYIPDDGGFPYTRTVFDMQGRVSRQGGMGAAHTIGSGHESVVLESPVTENTLYRLFGTDVGFMEHYRLVMARDANGQWSISYNNLSGQTIATGLVGYAPKDAGSNEMVDALADGDYSYPIGDVSRTSLKQLNEYRETDDGKYWEISKEIPILEPNEPHILTYTFSGEDVFGHTCLTGDCSYLLEIGVFAPNGEPLDESGTALSMTYSINHPDYQSGATFADGPQPVMVGDGIIIELLLLQDDPVGLYRVVKRLYLANEEETVSQITANLVHAVTGTQPLGYDLVNLDSGIPCIDLSVLTEDTEPCPDPVIQITEPEDQPSRSIPSTLGDDCAAVLGYMATDMSPGGQYFSNIPFDGGYALEGGTYAWLELHAEGFFLSQTESLIATDSEGNPILDGNDMPIPIEDWEDVETYWNPEWLGDAGNYNQPTTLLHYHPEICHYGYCDTQYPQWSDDYNTLVLFAVTEVSELTTAHHPSTICSNVNHPLLTDDQSVVSMGGASSDFLSKVCDYVPSDEIEGQFHSMWDIAIEYSATPDSPFTAWQLFVQMYTREKDRALRKFYYDNNGIICPYLDTDLDLLSDSGIPEVEEGFMVYFPDEGELVEGTMEGVIAEAEAGNTNATIGELDELSDWFSDAAALMPCGNSIAEAYMICYQGRQATNTATDAYVSFVWGNDIIEILHESELSALCMGGECFANGATGYESAITWAECLTGAIREKLEVWNTTNDGTAIVNGYDIRDMHLTVLDNRITFTYPGELEHPDGSTVAFIEIGGVQDPFGTVECPDMEYTNCLCTDVGTSFGMELEGIGPITSYPIPQGTLDLALQNVADMYTDIHNSSEGVTPITITVQDILALLATCDTYSYDLEELQENLLLLPFIGGDLICWDEEDDCAELAISDAEFATQQNMAAALEELTGEHANAYRLACMGEADGFGPDDLVLESDMRMYHFTLYYHDRVGNLVRTVPPNGVRMLDDSEIWNPLDPSQGAYAEMATDGSMVVPDHRMPTEYNYNTVGQIYRSETPDGGETKMYYDDLGRVRYSRNAQQIIDNQFSYIKYDGQGRINESGMADIISTNPNFFNLILSDQFINNVTIYPWSSMSTLLKEKTNTYYDNYDGPMKSIINNLFVDETGYVIGQENTRGRVVATSYSHAGSKYKPDAITVYTYDVLGNATEYWKYDADLYLYGQDRSEAWKHFEYEFDLLSGKVEEMHYQKGERDMLSHRYSYDADLRLVASESSTDGFIWDRDAEYDYYPHGPLKRMELGDDKVQGLDYVYNISGWIKSVNASSGLHGNDPGQDGSGMFPADVMGYSLHYYDGDYTAIGVNNPGLVPGMPYLPFPTGSQGSLYNGNISEMCYNLTKPAITGGVQESSGIHWSSYRYDQLHRIKSMETKTALAGTTDWAQYIQGNDDAYATNYSYDPNGNLMSLDRHDGGGILIDDLSYYYNGKGTNTMGNEFNKVTSLAQGVNHMNRLMFVHDAANSGNPSVGDLSDQYGGTGTPGTSMTLGSQGGFNGVNYGYDAIGNLIRDDSEGITGIEWTVSGKVKRVVKDTGLEIAYTYDESGNRKGKFMVYPLVSGSTIRTITCSHYVRDASGNLMGLYDRDVQLDTSIPISQNNPFANLVGHSLDLKERHIYGSSRHGMIRNIVDMLGSYSEVTERVKGMRTYELSNHLGNVLNTITDVKVRVDDGNGGFSHYIADVSSMTDYYPFGWAMPERNVSNGVYLFGFNGKEKEEEDGNQYTTHFRQFDSRIGRWLSLDPMMASFADQSPYNFVFNRLTISTDVNGDCPDGDCDDYKNWSGGGSTSIPSSSTDVMQMDGELLSFTYGGEVYGWNSEEGMYTSTSGDIYSEHHAMNFSLNDPRYIRMALKESGNGQWNHPGTYIMDGVDEESGDKYSRVATHEADGDLIRSRNIYYSSVFPDVGTVPSFIPVLGPYKQAQNEFEDGNEILGIAYGAMAVSDVFMVKSILTGLTKGGVKALTMGNKPWNTREFWDTNASYRAMYGMNGSKYASVKNKNLHHWLIQQKGPIGKYVPNFIKHQMWNLIPMPKNYAIHGGGKWKALKYRIPITLYYGTPTYLKAAPGSIGLRFKLQNND